MGKQQYDAASIQFRRAVKADPQFSDAHYSLALSLARMGRWPEAYRELQTTVRLDQRHVAAHLTIAEFQLASRQTAAAREEVRLALAADPNNANAHLLLGDSWVADQDYKQALLEFALCQQLAPGNPLPFQQSGTIYVRQGQYPEAIAMFQRAIKVDETFVAAYLGLAQVYELQGKPEEQLDALQTAIHRNPKQVEPYLRLANILLKTARGDQIGSLFKQLRTASSDSAEALLAIGNFYFRTGDAAHARQVLTEELSRDPKNNAARRQLIEVTLNQQDWDYAEKLNKELLSSEPRDADGRLFEARLQFARGARTQALSNLEQLVHDAPELPLPHFYLGLAYARKGESSRAVAAFNDTLERNPSFVWAYVSLGELHLQQNSPKMALDFAHQALKLNPRFFPAQILEANAYIGMENFEAAASKLASLSAQAPTHPGILDRLAVAKMQQKQYSTAEGYLEAALRSQPDYVPALVDLMRLYGLSKQSERILPRVEAQIEKAPKEGSFYEVLGQIKFAAKDLSGSEQAFLTALRLNPGSALATLQLSRVYASAGRIPEAIGSAQKLLQMHPDYLPGYLLAGSLYEQAGNPGQAQQCYEAALERDRDYAPVLNNLAWLYSQHGGNLDMALSLAQRAKSRVPNDPAISDTLAWIEYQKGLYGSAVASLKETTQQSPLNGLYRFHYGMSLWKVDRDTEARAALQQALQLRVSSPEADEAKRILAQLDQKPAAHNQPHRSPPQN